MKPHRPQTYTASAFRLAQCACLLDIHTGGEHTHEHEPTNAGSSLSLLFISGNIIAIERGRTNHVSLRKLLQITMNAILFATKLCKNNFDMIFVGRYAGAAPFTHTHFIAIYRELNTHEAYPYVFLVPEDNWLDFLWPLWCALCSVYMAELGGPWNRQISFELTHKRMASSKMHSICTDVNSSIIHWYFSLHYTPFSVIRKS